MHNEQINIFTINPNTLKSLKYSVDISLKKNKKNNVILIIGLITAGCILCGVVFYIIKPILLKNIESFSDNSRIIAFFLDFNDGIVLKFLFYIFLFLNIVFVNSGIHSMDINILRENLEQMLLSINAYISEFETIKINLQNVKNY